ncbi:hypothetical protein SLU01_18740 [Sporosarcina luteola]|uniref:YkuS family protein n=1 Tax=Sporosarcina luteola TaxID=582850 RepID=A0A511Z7Y9_9BACL|nr:YkuS family protein [Sporosarcina luteola]GEN83562.1 hypothetical protein SLU01_18740 [Sporosarcina luteola]
MKRIAIEQPYEDVATALQARGYETKMFNSDEDVKGYDIGVVRAINEGNTQEFDFPVVSMRGMTIEEAVDAVEHKANLMQ